MLDFTQHPPLVWLQALCDVLIGLAFYSIPITLAYVMQRRQDFRFRGTALLLAMVMLGLGTTRAPSVWNLWHSSQVLERVVESRVIAMISLAIHECARWALQA